MSHLSDRVGIIGSERGKVDLKTHKTIIDQISKYAYFLHLYNWGEPLSGTMQHTETRREFSLLMGKKKTDKYDLHFM